MPKGKARTKGGRVRFAKPFRLPKGKKAMDNFLANGGESKRRR